MRAGFLLPGIALAAFAATMMFSGWPGHPVPIAHAPLAATPSGPPVLPARSALPVTAGSTVPAAHRDANETAVSSVRAADDGADTAATAAPQPPLPDASALPSYQRDQEARNAQALGSSRSR
jgi:hypothetical protein